jgi:Cu/Ag efflux pump CusA
VTEPDRLRDPAPDLAIEAPLARAAVVATLASVVVGLTFVPQLLGLALGGLSLARREGARRLAWLAVVGSLLMTVVWAVGLGLLVTWWASTR